MIKKKLPEPCATLTLKGQIRDQVRLKIGGESSYQPLRHVLCSLTSVKHLASAVDVETGVEVHYMRADHALP